MSAVRASSVLTGIDVLELNQFAPLKGKRIGLLSNPTGVNRNGQPTWEILRKARGVRLTALFGAEHGFDGQARAGEEVRDRIHGPTGLPIFSLYGPGPTRKPTASMLDLVDVLVYDIQDTGCRSYTYISSLGLAMESCAEHGKEFMVLDRPNPLGGQRVEGPELDPRFRSFVGQWPVPYVYGLTPGELARMMRGEGWIRGKPNLSVIPMRGWDRSMTWNETGLKWIASSPNVPRGDTPLYLVATGILGEIGGLNLGTGSSLSFQVIGAPWLDPVRFATHMNAYRLPGLRFEATRLNLNQQPDDGAEFQGVRLRVTQPSTAPIAGVSFYALEAVRRSAGRDLFKDAVRRGKSWVMFDKVTGSDRTRRAMQSGRSARAIVTSWKSFETFFRKRRQPYLLYTETAPVAPKPATKNSAPKPAVKKAGQTSPKRP